MSCLGTSICLCILLFSNIPMKLEFLKFPLPLPSSSCFFHLPFGFKLSFCAFLYLICLREYLFQIPLYSLCYLEEIGEASQEEKIVGTLEVVWGFLALQSIWNRRFWLWTKKKYEWKQSLGVNEVRVAVHVSKKISFSKIIFSRAPFIASSRRSIDI